MGIGKEVRLGRLFSHPSGRFASVAVDHLFNYTGGKVPDGLRRISRTLRLIAAGLPDAVTLRPGIALSAWKPHAGKIPFILQTSVIPLDDSFSPQQYAEPEDAVRLGANAVAVVAFVRGSTEAMYLKAITECVRAAARFDLPVISHLYARKFGKEVAVSYEPEDVAWAVRCALECGPDVIKVPYCNDVSAYKQIVSECTVPLVAAGGPKTETLEEALGVIQGVVQSGALGTTVGRNVWGFEKITEAVLAVKAVVHEGKTPREAMEAAGLS